MKVWSFRPLGRRLLSTSRGLRQDVVNQGAEELDPSKMYRRLSPVEHVLARPEVYIGSTDPVPRKMWIPSRLKEDVWKVTAKQVQVVPGFAKIFDEIIVNAADNYQRDQATRNIDVLVDLERNCISVTNDGRGPPVTMHKKEGVYIPEMIFGTLLTGSNFSDSSAAERNTAGRHGYGAKLTNIMSKQFFVETWDAERKKHFSQAWTNNMRDKSEPVIKDIFDAENQTRVEFYPDLHRFGMKALDPDSIAFMMKRTWDTAACLADKGVVVTWNGKPVPFESFRQYLELHGDVDSGNDLIIGGNEKFQYGLRRLGPSETSSQLPPVSFVNGVATYRGGTHVQMLSDAVLKALQSVLTGNLRREDLNHNFMFFANAVVNKPRFESQSKEMLTTKMAQLSKSLSIDSEFLTRLQRNEAIVSMLQRHLNRRAWSSMNRKRRQDVHLNLPKLDDAFEAGNARRSECTLILTEGDSAKALALAGFSVVGRNLFGVFPLQGKLLNVRDLSPVTVAKHAEIAAIVKILGLKFGQQYRTAKERSELRYGKLMLMTDQDSDGHHIKGLIINFLHHFWPSLVENDGFLSFFRTPVVRIRSKLIPGGEKTFYYVDDINPWLETLDEETKASLSYKYYKGLGTSTAKEGKAYFENIDHHRVPLIWNKESEDMIDMAFRKSRVEDRRVWLDKKTARDEDGSSMSYKHFFDTDLADFSRFTHERGIPTLADGMKKAQRKILFAAMKRADTQSEIKLPQLCGYASELTAYHHGEVSLHNAVIQMAQDFVGANNIPLLLPMGQYGTRLRGGHDAASPRYLYTKLSPLVRKIFRPEDDPLLKMCFEDGKATEPVAFCPVIPMVLVNGGFGLASAYAGEFPSYNPFDIIDNIERHLDQKAMRQMVPWYRGFCGIVQRVPGDKTGKFQSVGEIRMKSAKSKVLRVLELPVGKWTETYREKLIALEAKGHLVRSFREYFTESEAEFDISCAPKARAYIGRKNALTKFDLIRPLPNNFSVARLNGKIKQFKNPVEIMNEFLIRRKEMYIRRKEDLLNKRKVESTRLENESRFVGLVVQKDIKFQKTSKQELISQIESFGLARDQNNSYDYLTEIPVANLTRDRAAKLLKRSVLATKATEELEQTHPLTLYRKDLHELREAILEEAKPGGCLHARTREDMLLKAGPKLRNPRVTNPGHMTKSTIKERDVLKRKRDMGKTMAAEAQKQGEVARFTSKKAVEAEKESMKVAEKKQIEAEKERVRAAEKESIEVEKERMKVEEKEEMKAEKERMKAAEKEKTKAEKERMRAAEKDKIKAEKEKIKAEKERMKAKKQRMMAAEKEGIKAEKERMLATEKEKIEAKKGRIKAGKGRIKAAKKERIKVKKERMHAAEEEIKAEKKRIEAEK